MGNYERVIAEAQECLKLWPDKPVFQYHVFCALTALGDYDKATALFRQIVSPGYEARSKFQDWCMKYVFDTLEAGRSWHPADREPAGAAFLPMVEAEETYRDLAAKGRRLTTDGFSAAWSPDGKKLAFSLGVQGRQRGGGLRSRDEGDRPADRPRQGPEVVARRQVHRLRSGSPEPAAGGIGYHRAARTGSLR